MKRRLGLLALVAAIAAIGAQSAQPATAHLAGGGTASIGDVAFSQVAMNVSFGDGGSASGSFNCLMAGRSKAVLDAFGLAHIMKVQATPTAGSVSWPTATFSGPGFLIMDSGQRMSIDIVVSVDVSKQEFQLTVVGIGTLPVETFSSGGVALK